MILCKNCKNCTFLDAECLITAYHQFDVVSGKKSIFYSSAKTTRQKDDICGMDAKCFEPSKLYKFKQAMKKYWTKL